MPHTVRLGEFEGPLDLLLHLIEQEEVDITTIALAEVCEGYLTHLAAVEDRAPEEVADFLLIAAKLLYLKSLVLIPGATADPVEDTTGLTAQLRRYRAFVDAARELADRYVSPRVGYPTEHPAMPSPVFLPPPRCTAETLRTTYVRILEELEPIVRIPRAVIGRVIAIDDRIAEIRTLVAAQPRATFTEILRGRRSHDEQIVSFLALLELVKQREVEVRQQERFAPITVVRAAERDHGVFVPDTDLVPVSSS